MSQRLFDDMKVKTLKKMMADSPIVLEPYLKRVLDIGIVVNLKSPLIYQ